MPKSTTTNLPPQADKDFYMGSPTKRIDKKNLALVIMGAIILIAISYWGYKKITEEVKVINTMNIPYCFSPNFEKLEIPVCTSEIPEGCNSYDVTPGNERILRRQLGLEKMPDYSDPNYNINK